MGSALITGHWGPELDSAACLEAVADGFQTRAPHWKVECYPFGAGVAFVQALQPITSFDVIPVSSHSDLHTAGQRFLRSLQAEKIPVIEGGHLENTDGGVSFLEGLTGVVRKDYPDLQTWFSSAIKRARRLCTQAEYYAAYSSARPLFGPSSTLALNPDLTLRTSTDPIFNRQWMSCLHQAATPRLPVSGQDASLVEPGRIAGSGAIGGVGALVSVLGGRLIPDGDFLISHTDFEARMSHADLVVILEPELQSPALAESTLSTVTELAMRLAIPVLALGRSSSLSAHERSEWGIHGVLTDESGNLPHLGRRAAQTWAR